MSDYLTARNQPSNGYLEDVAKELLAICREKDLTIAVAESLTGGLVCSTLVSVAGASQVIRGGAVTYATDTKAQLLGVDRTRLDQVGPVDEVVCRQMSAGVAKLFSASIGIATTGVAGPKAQGGVAVGVVHVCVNQGDEFHHQQLKLAGGRTQIRQDATRAVLNLTIASLSK